ncbi:TRAP transporter small permease [Pseudohalocynthiibacter aestuariivivens]|nr:TRAP transporter small permease [Pseudohalocynthiibacter aestuariivivens]QIE46976.1 TRAP transporter small permease [Pseudohalocynthiibacter aestuariivivens]
MHRIVTFVASAMAVLGGAVLTLLIALTCVSILGRLANGLLHNAVTSDVFAKGAQRLLDAGVGPVLGAFELVEAGVAFAIFAFLPICQISGGHATVDLFTARLPDGASRVLQIVIDVVFALVLALIAWRLFEGMQGKMRYNETTFMLQMPIWWSYLASFLAAALAAVVGIYVALARLVEALTGQRILGTQDGSEA